MSEKSAVVEPGTQIAVPAKKMGLVERFASRFGVDPQKLLGTLKATAFRVKDGEVTTEQLMALLIVAEQYDLNPWTRQLFAFPDKQNGIVPVVGVDGWAKIINDRPQFDGLTFNYSQEKALPGDERFPGLKHEAYEWIECVIHRKDREHPTVIREELIEAYRPPFKGKSRDGGKEYTVESAWQTHTNRFLRHKALIQCGRIAFSLSGIYDEDEAQRIIDADFREVDEPKPTGAAGLKAALSTPSAAGGAASAPATQGGPAKTDAASGKPAGKAAAGPTPAADPEHDEFLRGFEGDAPAGERTPGEDDQ